MFVTLPIRHPWRMAYINCDIGKYLNKVCDHNHGHAPCSGLDALYSQGYTPFICDAIRQCFKNMHRKSTVYVSVPAAFEDLDSPAAVAPSVIPALACVEMSSPKPLVSVWDTLPRGGVATSMAEWPTLPGQAKGRSSGSSGDPLPAEAGAKMPPFKPLPVKGKPKARGSVGEHIGSPPPAKKASVPEKKMPATSPPPLKPPPATPAEAGGGGSVPQNRRPTTPRREPRTRDEGDQPRAAEAAAGGEPTRRPKTPPPSAGGSSKKKLPTKEEDKEVITRQEQKARESALQHESIEAMNERAREMVKIIRECIAESARGNIMTHMARLVQLRAYGNHNGDHTWLQTITAFQKRYFAKGPPG